MKKETIFIQIASYRDPQLLPTIKNCIEEADNPDNLVFGISHQYNKDDSFSTELLNWMHSHSSIMTEEIDPNKLITLDLEDCKYRIINVDYTESKGACWARHILQQLYRDEAYTLQIDSHMRFAKGWDTELIKMIKQLKLKGHNKPLLTTYAPSFDPDDDPGSRKQVPWRMDFDRFIPEGAVFFLPASIPNHESLTEPVAARFYSAHMAFAEGIFAVEVQHDPNYYFHGEEISIAVRAYTHGYDLFHPHKALIWHEYTRKGRDKCWDDDKHYSLKNDASHALNRRLFSMDGNKPLHKSYRYGFGKERTLEDYERYSGLRFKDRSVQQYTIEKKYPPNPVYLSEEEYEASFARVFKHCIDISLDSVPEIDYTLWAIVFEDENGKDIYRKDADAQEIRRLKLAAQNDGYIKIWRQFETNVPVKSWTVWPHSESKGWMNKITGKL